MLGHILGRSKVPQKSCDPGRKFLGYWLGPRCHQTFSLYNEVSFSPPRGRSASVRTGIKTETYGTDDLACRTTCLLTRKGRHLAKPSKNDGGCLVGHLNKGRTSRAVGLTACEMAPALAIGQTHKPPTTGRVSSKLQLLGALVKYE